MELERKVEALTQQVDDALVVGSEESDGVFEEQHEGCVDDSVGQLVGINLVNTANSSFTHRSAFCPTAA